MHSKGTESIRLGQDTIAKLRALAKREGRTIRGQAERILRAGLR